MCMTDQEREPVTDTGGIFQVAMLDVLREPFEQWLASRGLALVKIPTDEETPTFTTTPVRMDRRAAYLAVYLDRGEGWKKMLEQIDALVREGKDNVVGVYFDVIGAEGQRERGEALVERTREALQAAFPDRDVFGAFLVARDADHDPRHAR